MAFGTLKILSKLRIRGIIGQGEITKPQIPYEIGSTVMQCLVNTSLLLLQLNPKWWEIIPIKEALRRLICQTDRGFGHNPIISVNHTNKFNEASTYNSHFMNKYRLHKRLHGQSNNASLDPYLIPRRAIT